MLDIAHRNSQASRERDHLKTVTSETFALVLGATGPAAVEFMSYGCEHCRVLEPILQQVAERLAGSAQLFRVNVAVEAMLAASYEVSGTPTLLMFLDGVAVGRVEGPQPDATSLARAIMAPFE